MIDVQSMARGLAGPNVDTREWVTHALVAGSTDLESEDCCVDFSNGYPLVSVLTQPGLVPMRCRVGSMYAGNGEGEWVPMLPGDEVLVLVPGGNSRAGGVIICKLNNEIDVWPSDSVAGQDPKQNNFSFRRTRTPHIAENSGPILMRDARTGAVVASDDTGALTFRSGNPTDPTAPAPAARVAADLIGWQDGKSEAILQLNLTDRTFNLRMDDAVLTLCSGKSSVQQNMLSVAGMLAIGTDGNPPIEHVTTAEAVYNIIYGFFTVLNAALTPIATPLTGSALATLITTMMQTGIPAAIPDMSTAALPPTLVSAIQAAFALAPVKPNAAGGQSLPGLGCPGLLAG